MNYEDPQKAKENLWELVKDIEGTTSRSFKFPEASEFHTRLMKNGLCKISRKDGPTYSDIKIRSMLERSLNEKHFMPKGWNLEKLLYCYDKLLVYCSILEAKVKPQGDNQD